MNTPSALPRKSITDSPWYWVYLFCTAAAITLMLAGPKFVARQAQIERNSEDRLRVARSVSQPELPATRAATEQLPATRITLWPLYVILGVGLSAAWFNLWRWHKRGLAGDGATVPQNKATL